MAEQINPAMEAFMSQQNFPAEQNDPELAELMAGLETEPATALPMAGPDIPALREQLAILVCTGKCKEAIGASFSQDQVKRLGDKEVLKYYKRYETYIGSKTTESLIENFLSLSIKVVGQVVKIDNADALKAELKNDFCINKELSQFFGGLTLRFGKALVVANSLMYTLNHVDFSSDEVITEQITEQSSEITEQLVSITE